MSTPEEMAFYKEIFVQGFWSMLAANLVGLMIRIVRMLRRPGVDVLD